MSDPRPSRPSVSMMARKSSRRVIRRGEQRPRVPWGLVVGAVLLLVLVGRGLVSTGLWRRSEAAGAPVRSAGPTGPPTDGVPTGTPGVTGTGPDPSASVPTSGPTPSSGGVRVTLPEASPSTATTTTGSPGGVTPRPTTPGRTTPGRTTPASRPGPTTSRPVVAGSPIVGVQSGKCVDVAGGSAVDFARIELSTCSGGAAQAIRYTGARELRVLGKCLDALGQGTASGTSIILFTRNGQFNQKWTFGPNGTILGVQSGLCLDATSQGTADGTPLELWACNGGANQAWRR